MRAKSGAVSETHASPSTAHQHRSPPSFVRHVKRQMTQSIDRRRPKHRCAPVHGMDSQHSTAIRQEHSHLTAQMNLSALGPLGSLSGSADLCSALHCSDVGLPRAAVLGVLGGGQLGKMLATDAVRLSLTSLATLLLLQAGLVPTRNGTLHRAGSGVDQLCLKYSSALQARMGINMEVLDPTPDCPASRVAKHTLGSFKEPESIR